MADIRALKSRITSVQNIRQITKAMEMVATTKLRRFQARAEATSPYAAEIRGLMASLASSPAAREGNVLFEPGKGEARGVLFITSDRGLCGAYNTNIFRKFEAFMEEEIKGDLRIYVIGSKGLSLLTKKGLEPLCYFDDPPLEKADFRTAQCVARRLVKDFKEGVFADLTLVYTAFVSMAKYEPTAEILLPLDPELLGSSEEDKKDVDYILEPDRKRILEALVPKFLEIQVFNSMIQSLTSEFASRRVAMKNATDAAMEMKEALTRAYNRARQEAITKELLDIVGGAEALR